MQQMVIGIIRGVHGLTGTWKIESTSGECDHFFRLTEVTLRNGELEKVFQVESVKGNAASLLMKCKGIDSPEIAKTYSGWKVEVPKDMACPLNEGQFYIEDLKQCALVYNADAKNGLKDNSNRVVGFITDVLEGGAGYLLEVSLTESLDVLNNSTDMIHTEKEKNDAGSDAKKAKSNVRLIPFKDEFIGTVDIKNRIVQLMHLWILE